MDRQTIADTDPIELLPTPEEIEGLQAAAAKKAPAAIANLNPLPWPSSKRVYTQAAKKGGKRFVMTKIASMSDPKPKAIVCGRCGRARTTLVKAGPGEYRCMGRCMTGPVR